MHECKSCEREFSNEVECSDHEQTCKGKLVIHICAKCKTVTTYWDSKIFSPDEFIKKNCCHVIKVETPKYGSVLDGKKIKIPYCDKCLKELVDSLPEDVQDEIYGEEVVY